tara:strand:- start:2171 stop:3244 length:1074 start_codon:yes stop_codon:yes gene_type:complete
MSDENKELKNDTISAPSSKMIGPEKSLTGASEYDNYANKSNTGYDNYVKSGIAALNNFRKGKQGSGDKVLPLEGEEPDKLTMQDETQHSFKRLFTSTYNLGLIFGSIGVKKIIDYIAKLALNTDDLSSLDKDEAIGELTETLNKVQSVVKDEKTKEAFGRASSALGELVSVFMEEAQEPFMKVGERAVIIGLHSLTVMFQQAMGSLEDAFKLVPILGDGYIILENVVSMSKSSANVGQGVMKYYSDLASAYSEISESLGVNSEASEQKTNLMDALKDIQKIIKESMNEAIEQNEDLTAQYGNTIDNKDHNAAVRKDNAIVEAKQEEEAEENKKMKGGNNSKKKRKVRFKNTRKNMKL